MRLQHIVHSIPPTYDERSRVLVLGSLPSPASRELGFNYGHPRNRFWRVMALLADEPLPATNDGKRDFCLRHHMALWDVVAECDIEGASDASIRNAVPNRLADIVRAAPIEAVFCTGARAHGLYRRLCEADVGMPAARLPSTSPANAACGLDRLLREYAAIFAHEHAFEPPVLDVPAVVRLEQAVAAAGTPLSELMSRAGAALAWRVQGILRELAATGGPGCAFGGISAPAGPLPVVLLCGNGNNGGDGWVAAAQLARAGVPACVVAAKEPGDLAAQPAHDAAVSALGELLALGGRMAFGDDLPGGPGAAGGAGPLVLVDPGADLLQAVLSRARVVVDAVLGTGASGRSPREPFAGWIRMLGECAGASVVLACDVPSGVSAQDGAVADVHVTADETLAMMVRKPGLAAPECGRVRVAPLAYVEPFLG